MGQFWGSFELDPLYSQKGSIHAALFDGMAVPSIKVSSQVLAGFIAVLPFIALSVCGAQASTLGELAEITKLLQLFYLYSCQVVKFWLRFICNSCCADATLFISDCLTGVKI